MLDILEDYLELRGLVCSRLDGSMAFSERERQMTIFRESPDCMVFLLSTRAGGLGINLTSADTVIIYDSDWNPQADLQAQDRCHRIGQTQPVMVYRLVTANTIDQRIVERAATKRRLEKIVIHKGKFKGLLSNYELSVEDLIDLMNSVDHQKVVNSRDAVISDESLVALLDRTLQSEMNSDLGFKERGKEKDNLKTASSTTHSGVFRVLSERDSSGKLIAAYGCEQAESTEHDTGKNTEKNTEHDIDDDSHPSTISNGQDGGASENIDAASSATPRPASSKIPETAFKFSTSNSSPSATMQSKPSPSTSSSSCSLPSSTPEPASSASDSLSRSSYASLTSTSPPAPPPVGVSQPPYAMDTDASCTSYSSALLADSSTEPTPEPISGEGVASAGMMVADSVFDVSCADEVSGGAETDTVPCISGITS